MIKSIETIEGLGGCGKTYKFLEISKELRSHGVPIAYLTFNKRIANKTKEKLEGYDIYSGTIHSFMYNEVSYVTNLAPFPDDNKSDKEQQKYFKNVEKLFLSIFKGKDKSFQYLKNNTVLFVDEYQNVVESNLFKCLKLISEKIDVRFCFMGDRYQEIYKYLGKRTNTFSTIEKDFEQKAEDPIILNINKRSNASVLAFINSFLELNVKPDKKYLYKIDRSIPVDKQELHFFTNMNDEFNYVNKQILQLYSSTKDKIVILGRWNRNLKLYEEWKKEANLERLEISTIHKYIGDEANVVFMVGYEFLATYDESCISYTGFLRAKDKIIITTSYPKFDQEKLCELKFLDVIDEQKQVSKKYKQLKLLKNNKNLTTKKFDHCMIDSLSLTVRGPKVPYFRYVEHDKQFGRDTYEKSIILHEDLECKLRYNKPNKNYTFVFKDLNLLRKNNYSDIQVLQYCSNTIFEYFNNQVKVEDIEITSLDICLLFSMDDEILKKTLTGGFKCKDIRFSDSPGSSKTILNPSYDYLKKGTVYLNFRRDKSLTLAIYKPSLKTNDNQYHRDDLVKLEFRIRNEIIENKYIFGDTLDVKTLIDRLRKDKDYLRKVFFRIVDYKKKLRGFDKGKMKGNWEKIA